MSASPDVETFTYNGGDLVVTDAMQKAYERDGFLIIKGLWSKQEVAILDEALQGPGSLTDYCCGIEDEDGNEAKISLWSYTGNDTTGTLARTQKMAGTSEKLLGGEVFHYHSKVIMKNPHSKGKWDWHQDYGYWYNFAFLYPDMLTAFVAIDKMDEENGCLHVLKGSHRCGRIQHSTEEGQTEADLARVKEVEQRHQHVFVRLEAGDTMFFHCNLLHTSAPNTSDRRRWALLAAYSRADNRPFTKMVGGDFRPLELVANDAVVTQGVNRDLQGKEVLKKVGNEYKVVVP